MKKSCKNCKAANDGRAGGCSLGYRTIPSTESYMYPDTPDEECCKPMTNKAYLTAWKLRQHIIYTARSA